MKKILILTIALMLLATTATLGATKVSHGKSYTKSLAPSGSYPDSSNAELTNGTMGPSWPLDYWVGWTTGGTFEVDVTVDLVRDYTITSTKAHCMSWTAAGIYYPENVKYWVYRDGSENSVYVGQANRPADTSSATWRWFTISNTKVGRKVLMRFYQDNQWLFVDEIEAWGDVKQYDIGIGKFYTYDVNPAGNYPDEFPVAGYSEGSELSDGGYGASWPLSHWVGFDAYTTPIIIRVDLGKNYTIDSADLHCASWTGAGIYYPSTMEVYTSLNGVSYTYKGNVAGPSETGGMSTSWINKSFTPTTGRHVAYVIYHNGGEQWQFVDEFRIKGHVTQSWKGVPSSGAYNGAYTVESTHGYLDVNRHQNDTYHTLSMLLWYNDFAARASFESAVGYLWDDEAALGEDYYGGSDYGDFRYLSLAWLPYDTTAAQLARGNLYPSSGTKFDQFWETWFEDSMDNTKRNDSSDLDPIWLRPMNEFNGGWTWSGSPLIYGGDPTNFKRAWRRMYNIAEQVGANDDIIWEWAPAGANGSTSSSHDAADYYPGDQYVDWVGMSVYSDTGYYPVAQLTSTCGYGGTDIQADYGYKPLMIAEGAVEETWSTESNRNIWIDDWFDTSWEVPEMKAFIWYNDAKMSCYEWDRLDTSQKNELRSEVDNSYWKQTP